MIKIDNKLDCCGCSACYNKCPKNCITMESDEEGFLYPKINETLCVNCGLCEQVCPLINPPKVNEGERKSVVVRIKNKDTLQSSTSGGFFTAVAKYVLACGGVVCAATYSDQWVVFHDFIENYDEEILKNYRGSKYVQSELNDCFDRIRKFCESGRLVCFIGTTCQVSGLKKFLGDNENLIAVDLVCHGTPSPKLFQKYVEYQKTKYNSDIVNISFRNKTYGYHSGTMKIEFSNGKIYYGSARVDYMLKSFFKEIASRPICYSCPFKTLERSSDFTIYDCWHISELVETKKDDDCGYTNVILQSVKAEKILNELRDYLEIYEVRTDLAVKLDGKMVLNSAKPHERRNEFYKELDAHDLDEHINMFIPVSKIDRMIEKSKKFLYKTRLMNFFKKFK